MHKIRVGLLAAAALMIAGLPALAQGFLMERLFGFPGWSFALYDFGAQYA